MIQNTYAGAGVLIEDLNLDGWLDLILLRRNGVRLLLNQQNGEWQEGAVPEIVGIAENGSIVDYDGDGDQDIVINSVLASDVLWTQEEDGWRVDDLLSPINSGSSVWYDINKDQRLDLLIAGYGNDQDPAFSVAFENGAKFAGEDNIVLFQQEGHTLEQVSIFSGNSFQDFTFNLSVLPFDSNQYWDVFTTNDFGMLNDPHKLFWNQGGEEHALATESLGIEARMFGMGLGIVDYNSDQRPDLMITNIGNPVFLLSAGAQWYDASLSLGFQQTEERATCWGVDWGDVNRDGHPDLWMGCGPLPIHEGDEIPNPPDQPDALFLWTENGYQDVSSEWGVDRRSNTRGGGFADLNNDGCLDLIRVPLDAAVEIFEGKCTTGNWLKIRLNDRGTAGIGSQVEVLSDGEHWTDWMTAGGNSFSTYLPLELYFGLGKEDAVDIKVTWSDGEQNIFEGISSNQAITLER